MRNYLSAECFKTFHRKYFYAALGVCLVLEAVLLWGYWLTLNWGNPTVNFSYAATTVSFLLSMGLYATLITGDVVFSDQYKNDTLKNEVSYGLPRARIYLGKLGVSILVALIAAVVMLAFYVVGCWFLFPHDAQDAQGWSLMGYCLAGALPLWLAAQAVVIACYFLVGSATVAAFLAVGILGVIPSVLQAFGLLFHPVFEMLRQFTPSVMLDSLRNMAFDGGYLGLCWLVGLLWFAAATALGLFLFQRKEIR